MRKISRAFAKNKTRVFTLLYPNPIAVAQVIQQVIGNRVQMNRADADMDDLLDLSRRFNRFDMVRRSIAGLGGALVAEAMDATETMLAAIATA